MWYCPVPSVTADRDFSINVGLAASTVTPGSTAPDASLTVPASATCAHAALGRIPAATASSAVLNIVRIYSTFISYQRRQNVKPYSTGAILTRYSNLNLR